MNFDEAAWMRLLFLLSDTQGWIEEMERDMFLQVPLAGKKALFRKNYRLTANGLAHILERHYHKISRHPGTGKFVIPVVDILHWIREAQVTPSLPLRNSPHFIRSMDTCVVIGHDQYGIATTMISVITDGGGEIKTAFPGVYRSELIESVVREEEMLYIAFSPHRNIGKHRAYYL